MFHDMINVKDYRSVLCLNGDLPDIAFFTGLNLPVIAADGAANNLLKLGIIPELIIGDLDSVNPRLLENNRFIHIPDQDSCDYQKAMQHLKEQNLLPAIIVGINGGFLDHVLNNINIFMESDSFLYAPPISGMVLNAGCTKDFSLPFRTKISLIGIPETTVSSIGLQWELDHANLAFPGKSSCFNRTVAPEIMLNVHQGSVLVLIYNQLI